MSEYFIDPSVDIQFYDRLPKIIRYAMKHTVRNWSAQEIRDLSKEFATPSLFASFLVRCDRDIAQKENLYDARRAG